MRTCRQSFSPSGKKIRKKLALFFIILRVCFFPFLSSKILFSSFFFFSFNLVFYSFSSWTLDSFLRILRERCRFFLYIDLLVYVGVIISCNIFRLSTVP